MIKEMNKKSEFKHFEKLSNEWWNPEGKFKILHELTPLRVKYIKNMCFDTSYKKKSKKRLDNLDILDLGCGGGLLSEPLTRLGANVTGIDFIKQDGKYFALEVNSIPAWRGIQSVHDNNITDSFIKCMFK